MKNKYVVKYSGCTCGCVASHDTKPIGCKVAKDEDDGITHVSDRLCPTCTAEMDKLYPLKG